MPPRVSYLIIVRNRAETMQRCLSSITNQSVDQVVVVDGCSIDGTSQIIDVFSLTHLYDDGKGNLSAARNLGLEECTGEYIVIIDGDQWIPKRFDKELKKALNANNYDAVILRILWPGSSGKAKARQAIREATEALRPSLNLPRVYKHSILSKVGGWDEGRLCQLEDHDLWNRVKRLSPRVLRSRLAIYSDTPQNSAYREFSRARVTAFSLSEYVRRYPSEWQKCLSVAPIGWAIDLVIAAKVLLATRSVKIALLALPLRMAGSIGWLIGLFSSGIPSEAAKKKENIL